MLFIKFSKIGLHSAKLRNMSTLNRLEGKVAVVTASTSGIGLAIAKKLAQDGAKVVISSRRQENVDKALATLSPENLEIAGTVCHVSNAKDRNNLFLEAKNKFGGIDILVSNAAVNPMFGPLFECTETGWDKIFDVNVKSAFLLCKEVLPYFRERNGGKIVLISSIAGYHSFPQLGAYAVSKCTLFGLTKAAALDLAPDNIQVNCVAPGLTETRFAGVITGSESMSNLAYSRIPMNRIGTPEEIAGAVAFLASKDADYVTGESLAVAGGVHSNL